MHWCCGNNTCFPAYTHFCAQIGAGASSSFLQLLRRGEHIGGKTVCVSEFSENGAWIWMPKWVFKMGVQDGRMLWGVSEGIITQKRETICGGVGTSSRKYLYRKNKKSIQSQGFLQQRISFSHKLSHILDRYIASSFRDWDILGD